MRKNTLNTWRSWVIAVACCIVYSLIIIVYRLSAIFYVEIIEEYKVDRDTASIPFAITGLVRCLSGLPFGILAERFGYQRILYLGCCFSALGAGASYFVHNVTTLSITVGLIYGIGFTGVALLPNVIREHFDDTATTISNGLLNVGPCLTAIVFPALVIHFIEEYGLSGSFLLTSGIILNSLPFIMLLKPRTKSSKCRKKVVVTKNNKLLINQNDQLRDVEDLSNQNMPLSNEKNASNSNNSKEIEEIKKLDLQDDKINIIKVTTTFITKKVPKCSLHNKEGCSCIKVSYFENECELKNVNQQKVIEEMSNPIPNNSECQLKKGIDIENSEHAGSLKADSQLEITKVSTTSIYEIRREERKGFFYTLNVLKDPTFLLLSFIQGLYGYTFHIWLTTMIDYSRDKGIDHSYEIYILTLNPITDIAGRLGLAWITDKGYVSVPNFCAALYIVLALSSICIALATDFAIMLFGILVMTFAIGGYLSIYPAMSYAFIEKDKQAVSVASIGLFYAPLSFTVAPLTGYFRGHLGSYDGLYYLLAVMNSACSIIVLMLPKLANRRERRKLKRPYDVKMFEINSVNYIPCRRYTQ